MLPLGNTHIKQALICIFYSTTEVLVHIFIYDERLLLATSPNKVKSVIINMRLMIKNDLIDPIVVTDICLEYTFSIGGGKEHIVYRKKLFTIGNIKEFVLFSASKYMNSLL